MSGNTTSCRSKSGMTFVIVSLMLGALTVLGATVYSISRIDTSITDNYKKSVDAFFHAEAGVQFVLAAIKADIADETLVLDQASEPVNYSAPSGYNFDTVTNLSRLADGISYWFQVTGHAGNSSASLEVVFKSESSFPFGLFGAGLVTLENGSIAYSPVGSNDDIELKVNSDVNGNAIPGPGKTTDICGSCGVTGSTTPASDPIVLDPVDAVALADAQTNNDNAALPSEVMNGDEIFVNASEGFTMPAGTYYFTQMTIKDAVDLAGTVVIYCTGDIEITSSATVNNNTGDPDKLTIWSTTTGTIELKAASQFYGYIHAPDATSASLLTSAQFHGTLLCGGTVTLKSSAEFHRQGSASGGGDPQVQSWRQL